jgi:hypothetical protein
MIWILAAVVIGLLNWYAPADPTGLERVLASAIVFVCLWGIRYWRKAQQGEFGFFPVVLFVYIVFFPLPIFTLQYYNYREPMSPGSVGDANLEKALFLTLVGVIGLVFGYYYPGHRAVRVRLPKICLNWSNPRTVAQVSISVGALSLIAFAITTRLRLDISVQAWINLPNEFIFLAIIALFVLQLQGRLGFASTLILWGFFVPARLILGMAQGQFALGVAVVVALVVSYATMMRRFPWTLLLVGMAAFCLLQPMKGAMRQEVFIGGWVNPEMDNSDKLESLYELPMRGLDALNGLGLQMMISLATIRLADAVLFAHIISYTPDEVSYWDGESYSSFLTMLIPRFLFPEKPTYLPGNVLGHRYDLLPPYDYVTSINMPQLVEFYLNFGPLALAIGGVLIGVLYRTINDLLMDPAYLGSIVGGIFILARLSDIENSAISVFGSNLLMGIIVVVLFHAAIRFFEAATSALAVYRAGPQSC